MKKEDGCEISLPRQVLECEATVNGYQVPYFKFIPVVDREGFFDMVVDGRFGTDEPVHETEIKKWMWIIAHAMAVSAGQSCHGKGSRKPNPHKVKVFTISPETKPELNIVKPTKEPKQ